MARDQLQEEIDATRARARKIRASGDGQYADFVDGVALELEKRHRAWKRQEAKRAPKRSRPKKSPWERLKDWLR